MAGSISLSISQQFDELGAPLAGGLLYFIVAGTTSTPQNAFQDSALTLPWPNPLTLDAAGRVPQLYFADGFIKVRMTDKNGVQQLTADNILVVGPSSGSGGGGTVDPTTILATGDMKLVYGTGVITGFVRANGRTIGSATSGSSERANLDCQALFQYLWGADPNLAVSTGRGASANADWVANKQITLPDFRGRTLAGLDDMGNSAAGNLTSSFFGSTPTVLGAVGGQQDQILHTANMPPYTPTTASIQQPIFQFQWAANPHGTGGTPALDNIANSISGGTTETPTRTTDVAITMNPQGGTSSPVGVVQPTILITTYIKL